MSDYGVKETTCTHCVHREVCSKKELFLRAQKAADNLDIMWDDGNGEWASQKVYNLDWIKPIELSCKYCIEEKPSIQNMGGLHA